LDEEEDGWWDVAAAMIRESDVFVGEDGAMAAVAATTDTPMVVAYSCRPPRMTRPFRRGVPFEALVPGPEVCSVAERCFSENARGEFCHMFRLDCSNEDGMVCRSFLDADAVCDAVLRVLGMDGR
jgi:hypothetical protein